MKEPNKDDERLSALLEGKVQGEQREELLAHLARNENDYAVFASTGAVLRALEEEDARAAAAAGQAAEPARADVIPLRPRSRAPRLPGRWLALAASIATIALASTLTLRTRAYPGALPVHLAVRADTAGTGLPVDLVQPWSTGRGPGTDPETVESVRAGVMLTNLALAARAGDTGEIRALAAQLGVYDPGASPDTPLPLMAADPTPSPDSLNVLLNQAADRLGSELDRKRVEFGAWAQAARVAARQRNGAFFDDDATDVMLGRAERMSRNASARAAVDGVRAALPANAPPRWDTLRTHLDALLSELTR